MEVLVVFSPESFVPRLVMTNLTIHLMGQAINLLEASSGNFFLSLYSRDTWCIEVQNIFCFPITVPLASYGFHCCSKVAFRLMTPLHNGLSHNKTTRSDSTVYQYVC